MTFFYTNHSTSKYEILQKKYEFFSQTKHFLLVKVWYNDGIFVGLDGKIIEYHAYCQTRIVFNIYNDFLDHL